MQENRRLLDNGRFYHRQGRLAEAADIYRQVARADPANALAHHLLGLVYHQQSLNPDALRSLGEAARLEPKNPLYRVGLAEALYVGKQDARVAAELTEAGKLEPQTGPLLLRQAVLWGQLDRAAEAAAAAERAVTLQPDLGDAHQVLGMLLRERGELARAAEHLAMARNATPAPIDPTTSYGFALLALGRYAELEALGPAKDPKNRYREAVLKALAAWHRSATEACAGWLAEADRAAATNGARTADIYESYHKHLEALFAERQRDDEPYRERPERTVAAIGDAQVLAAANLVLPIGGRPSRIEAAFVPGCKALLLVRKADNACRAAFEAALDRQPKGRLVIASVGDLDCRYTSGFMEELRRNPSADGVAIVERTVSLYADWVAWAVRQRGLDLVLQGPAASNATLDLVDAASRRRYLELVAHFNAKLGEAARENGVGYVDLFAATADAGRRGRPECFVDANHVRPSAIAAAIAAAGI